MGKLKLTYPSLQAGEEFMLDPAPSAINKWLQQLTFNDIDVAMNDILHVARTLNRSKQKTSYLQENFYHLDQAYFQLSRHFREQNDKRGIKIGSEQYQALHNLTTEMAFFAKRLTHELANQKFALNKANKVSQAINYSMHYLGLMLIEQYQLYAPVPAYIWRELHTLYRYAQENKQHKTELHADIDSLNPLLSIEQTYVRNCLMAVINPYHIEKNQHWQLFKYLAHWSKLAIITNNLDKYSENQCFIIDLSGNNKPHFANQDDEYQDESEIRLLLTHDLIKCIQAQIDELSHQRLLPNPGFYLSIERHTALKLLERIYGYCDHHIQRKDIRYPLSSDIDTVWNLAPALKVLEAESTLTDNQDLDLQIQKVLGDNYQLNIRWQSVNHSDGGACIKQIKQDVRELKVGSLLLVKKHHENQLQKHWQVGISRWLNGTKNSGSTVGLEFIHGKPSVVHYLTNNKNAQQVKHKVLLVRPFDNTSFPTIITAKNLIGAQRHIKLEIEGTQVNAHLTNMVESSSNIAVFNIRIE